MIFREDDSTIMKIIKTILTGLTIIAVCSLMSCSASQRASRHIRRAQKIDPTIFSSVTTTVTTRDTVYIDVPVVEFKDRLHRDTLIEYKQGETIVRYRYTTKTDSLFIEADCPDTKEITETNTTTTDNTIVLEKKWWDKIKDKSYIVIMALAIFSVYLLLRKRK
jgi:hypothetical protein